MRTSTTARLTLRTLQTVWGYDQFRPPQQEIIRTTLGDRDLLAILPTGGGKSICFQLPALLKPGLTLVISPLVALMEDQVRDLQGRGVAAERLHSQLSTAQRRQVLRNLPQLRLLYLSPETLLSAGVWLRLCDPQLVLSGLVIDEAHCLVQWGQSFRPAYARLGAVRQALQAQRGGLEKTGPLPIAAFTATADLPTQRSLIRSLQLDQPEIFQRSIYRANLHLRLETVWSPRHRLQRALRFVKSKVQEHQHQSGLVYVRTRRDSETLVEQFQRAGIRTAAYHAGLSDRRRRQIEQDWLENRLLFVVCTSAFGMGINKANVRWVLHYHLPLLLSEYVQEIGRGGRDGLRAEGMALVSEPTGWLDPSDRQRNQFFLDRQAEHTQAAQKLRPRLAPMGGLDEVAQQFPQAEQALATLHHQGQLHWIDPFHYALTQPPVEATRKKRLTGNPPAPAAASLALTQTWLRQRDCRWQGLLELFGGRRLEQSCGHCDRCRPA